LEFLANKAGIDYFFETGTEEGRTSLWASKKFKKVFTVEASKERYEKTLITFNEKKADNIEFVNGESTKFLRNYYNVQYADVKTLFWLDARWTHASEEIAREYYGRDVKHPLLEELKIVSSRTTDDIIFVDDMRFIIYPFTPPRSTQEWPSIQSIFNVLFDKFIVIYGDVLIAMPYIYYNLLLDWKKEIKGTELDIL
jgi:hypothetical protein